MRHMAPPFLVLIKLVPLKPAFKSMTGTQNLVCEDRKQSATRRAELFGFPWPFFAGPLVKLPSWVLSHVGERGEAMGAQCFALVSGLVG